MNANEILNKARQLNKFANLTVPTIDIAEKQNAIKYDGSFKTIYDLVMADKLKLFTDGDILLGLSIDSGAKSIEEDIWAGENFARAYTPHNAYKYSQAALALKAANIIVDAIKDDKYLFLYAAGKVLDLDLDEVVTLSTIELAEATLDNIYEMLETALTAKITTNSQTSNNPSSTVQTLPSEAVLETALSVKTPASSQTQDLPNRVVVEASEIPEVNLRKIKSYLKNKYNHFIAKNCELTYNYNSEAGTIIIENIEWGRKVSSTERS